MRMWYCFIWLEIRCIFLEQGEWLMACVFMEGWMWNHNWGVYEENQIMKILWIWYWRNVKTKIDVKEEVLSMISQVRWRISKINSEICHGKFRGQHIFKWHYGNAYRTQLITLNAKKRTSLQSSREEVIELEWSKLIPSQGRWL